jgi:hypothetical protein
LSLARLAGSDKAKTFWGAVMAKSDLDSLSIDELAALRDRVIEKLTEKVAARQVELEAELERLSQYGKPAKKAQAAPAKPKKNAAIEEPMADAAEAA